MPYFVTLLSLLFVFGGGAILIASQISEYAVGQRPLNQWVYQIPVAHRGLHVNPTIPENSLSAFKAAIAQGYAIELDVHLTQDGEAIVFHDKDLERVTGQAGTVVDTPYHQLKTYKLWKTEDHIPTLKEALDLVQGQVPLFIEIKQEGDAGPLEQKVYQLISTYTGPVILISFNSKSLEWFRINAPEVLRGQNLPLEDWQSLSFLEMCHKAFKHCRLSKPHVVIYNAQLLPHSTVKMLSSLKPFVAYNVTSHEHAATLKNIATNIIFDRFDPSSVPEKIFE